MAENKEYFTQEMENGSIQISEDVVASVTGMAVLEVEGVCGLSSTIGTDIAEMLGMEDALQRRASFEHRVWRRCASTATLSPSLARTSLSLPRTCRKTSSPASSLLLDSPSARST